MDATSVGANSVPNARQSASGLMPVAVTDRSIQDYQRRPPIIVNPRLAPSSVPAEQALQARSLNAPEFQHNMMMTRIMRTSNLHAETPRFRNQIDILA